ncbi:MAG: hypothetical protein A3E82_00670 [Gammaproteobacteria bacterium RIFCSPHIGHO2_12_FULL_38_11]|nr:MAG: hypothetical protein A3E82_00670 [Gammaproteobacteria bacterium RIFCSPHIGHO2_12_FULL_38_11]
MIILTGVSGGIGKEILPYLLKMDEVIGIYNKTEPQPLTNTGLVYEQLNLESATEIQAFVSKWSDKLSKVTVVHFAALNIDNITAHYPDDDWDRVMGVNLKGNFLLTKALLPHMVRERWGRIIHISSRIALNGNVGTIAYSTSKTGLMGMSRVLAKEHARFNVTSNVLVLGYFDAGLYDTLSEDLKKTILNQIPSKKLGKSSDIVNAIEFLMKSQYVNGAAINIDGGI